MDHQQPMPLKDLPEYLRQARENGDTSSPLVGMGQIIVPEEPSFWSGINKTALALLASFVLCIGLVTYDTMSKESLTVIVDVANPSQVVPQAVSDSGGTITAVRQINDSTYEVKISTRKDKKSFLEELRRRMNIKGYSD